MTNQLETIEDLRDIIADARWFESLGSFEVDETSDSRTVAVSPHAWRALVGACSEEEFGVAVTVREHEVPEFSDWLPTTLYQDDPIRGADLATRVGKASDARQARMEIAHLRHRWNLELGTSCSE